MPYFPGERAAFITKIFKPERNRSHKSDINKTIKCALWNVWSLNNKLLDIMEHILDLDPDVVFLTETWLESDNNSVTAEIKTYGYQLLHDRRKDREKEKGGGVGIMVKSKRTVKQLLV